MINDNQIIEYYKTHTGEETTKYFSISGKVLNRILDENNVPHHHFNESRVLKKINSFTDEQILEILEFYKENSYTETMKRYSLSRTVINTILDRYNLSHHTRKESAKLKIEAGTFSLPPNLSGLPWYNDGYKNYRCTHEKAKSMNLVEGCIPLTKEVKLHKQEEFEKTCLKRHGVKNYNNYLQIIETKIQNNTMSSKYCYDYNNLKFDSSWELAYYIYMNDKGENIIRNQTEYFTYHDSEDKEHKCFPDFKVNDCWIEIKGDHFERRIYEKHVDESDSLYIKKKNCLISNGVKFLYQKDLLQVFKYIQETYGKDYLNQFKRK